MYLGAWRNALYDWEGGFGCSKVLSAHHIQGNAEGKPIYVIRHHWLVLKFGNNILFTLYSPLNATFMINHMTA